jgi:hypothetical protein
MSLNRWGYVEGNPVNFIDPSGHIRNDATELESVEYLLSKLGAIYDVKVHRDWGWHDLYRDVYQGREKIIVGCYWEEGYWSLDELEEVYKGVDELAKEMGGPSRFRAKIGGTVYIRQVIQQSPGITHPPTWHVVTFWSKADSFDHWTVVHELGHVWDGQNNWKYSEYLEDSTDGYTLDPKVVAAPDYCALDPYHELPGCNKAGYYYGGTPPKTSGYNFNRREDFAESVTAYVYPDEAHAEVMDQLSRYKIKLRPDLYQLYEAYLYYDNFRATPRGRFVSNLVGK